MTNQSTSSSTLYRNSILIFCVLTAVLLVISSLVYRSASAPVVPVATGTPTPDVFPTSDYIEESNSGDNTISSVVTPQTDATELSQSVESFETFEVEWPREMRQGQSYRIRAELRYLTPDVVSTRIEFEGNDGKLIDIQLPVGATPNAPIAGAFGDQYEATIQASLTGPDNLNIRTDDVEAFILREGKVIVWDWHLTPEQVGDYQLALKIKASWENPQIDDIRTQLLVRETLSTQVTQRWFTLGDPFSLTAIVSAIAGAILAALITSESLRGLFRRSESDEKAASN